MAHSDAAFWEPDNVRVRHGGSHQVGYKGKHSAPPPPKGHVGRHRDKQYKGRHRTGIPASQFAPILLIDSWSSPHSHAAPDPRPTGQRFRPSLFKSYTYREPATPLRVGGPMGGYLDREAT